MKNSRIYKILLPFFLMMFITNYVFADDISPLDDNFDIYEVLEDAESIETNSSSSELPTINSRAYVVIDRKSNTVLVGKNENQKKKMASTTKIMTALIVIENCDLSETVEISKKSASTGGSRLGLKTGDKITVYDLLYGLMMRSGNDSAVALAEHTAGSISIFADLMNQKAVELGLSNTHFVTPHGLDEDEHYTTAYELALLSNYAMNNEIFAKIVGTKNYTITINGYPKTLTNTNELLGSLNGVYGIKTGFTNGANRCLVTCCKRGEMDLICVVLGADTKKYRTTDSIKLLEYSFSNFKYVNIEEMVSNYFETWKENNKNSFTINKGISSYLDLKYEDLEHSTIPIRNDLVDKFQFYITCDYILDSPISKGTSIGTITLSLEDKTIYSGNIITDSDVEKKSIFDYMLYFYKNFYNIFDDFGDGEKMIFLRPQIHKNYFLFYIFFYVFNYISYCNNFFSITVWNFYIKFFF